MPFVKQLRLPLSVVALSPPRCSQRLLWQPTCLDIAPCSENTDGVVGPGQVTSCDPPSACRAAAVACGTLSCGVPLVVVQTKLPAFEIAAPLLPLALDYTPLQLGAWRDKQMEWWEVSWWVCILRSAECVVALMACLPLESEGFWLPYW